WERHHCEQRDEEPDDRQQGTPPREPERQHLLALGQHPPLEQHVTADDKEYDGQQAHPEQLELRRRDEPAAERRRGFTGVVIAFWAAWAISVHGETLVLMVNGPPGLAVIQSAALSRPVLLARAGA